MFTGYIPAVVSPFFDNSVDVTAFEKYINWLIKSGVNGVVVCGSTGESIALTAEERRVLVTSAVRVAEKKVPVIAGIINAVTEACVIQAKEYEKCGADALLCVCPYYLKPTQEGVYEHFKTIHDAVSIPIILYNNPGRTSIDIKLDTLRKLASLERIMGLKEASSDVARFLLWRQQVKPGFSFLSGNDDTFCGALALGASGAISVTANVLPEVCSNLYRAWTDRDMVKFEKLRDKIQNVHQLLFVEPSPSPVKYALSLMGVMQDTVRAPLLKLTDQTKARIKQELSRLGVI